MRVTHLDNGRMPLMTFRLNWSKTRKSETRHQFGTSNRLKKGKDLAQFRFLQRRPLRRARENGPITIAYRRLVDCLQLKPDGTIYQAFLYNMQQLCISGMHKKEEKLFPSARYRRDRALSIIFYITSPSSYFILPPLWFILTFTRSFSDFKLHCPLKITYSSLYLKSIPNFIVQELFSHF